VDLWKFSNDFSHVSGRKLDHILSSERDLRYQNDSFGVYKNSKVSDHFPIFAIFNTQTSKENAPKDDNQQNQTQNNTQNLTKITDLNDIKNLIANNKPLKNRINLSGLIVSYTDQNGYLVTQILDKNGDINSTISAKKTTGIYVFDKKADVKIGDIVDLQIEEIGEFKENPQIIRPKITKFHDKKADLSKICVPQIQMFDANFGDVICEISGSVKHGYFYPNSNPQKAIKIYSKRAKISDGDYSFKNVLIQKFAGEKELVIQ
jgi:putative endonuclease/exonuclease/phosphatase